MGNTPIIMPQMGQSVAEGTIVRWRKKIGDTVALDEILVEIESDKISFEVESPAAGRLTSTLKSEGEKAAVGETIGLIQADTPAPAPPPKEGKPHAGGGQEQILVSTNGDGELDAFEFESLPDITRDWYSPYVLRLAVQNNVTLDELKTIRGSGRQGRVTRHDMLKYLARRPSKPDASDPGAEEPALDIKSRVSHEDEVVPMTTMRRTIADHMVQSIRTSAHVTMVHAVDVTKIVALRERIKDDFLKKHGVKMTYTGVMLFVTARVLRQFPSINSSVMGTNIIRHKRVNIGCAVALSDESLVVPVLKDADRKSFPVIAQELDNLIEQARKKALTRADIEGGTFTMSNFGSFGSLSGTPLIHQPQVAILGMGAVFKAPVVVDNAVCIRDQLYLSFSFDHRVIDGAMGGRFLNAIQRATEALDEKALDVAAL